MCKQLKIQINNLDIGEDIKAQLISLIDNSLDEKIFQIMILILI